ncbi:MAG: efflux RND transporter permease subunit [Bacteroidia bacterium]|nr:efflux RND transporter permease subunit [Bacteroidia bacterium]
MGMFVAGYLYGMTINVISLFGMILVVGILVDDGIVVGENIYQHYERGKTAIQAAIDGTMEVLSAVFTAVFTTALAFSAFFFLKDEPAIFSPAWVCGSGHFTFLPG